MPVASTERGRDRRRAAVSFTLRKARHVPHRITLIRSVALWLYPSPTVAIGLYASLMAITGCSKATLKHWLAGRRRISNEARDRLIAQVESRLAQGHALLDQLKALPDTPRPGKSITAILASKAKEKDLLASD